MLSLNDHLAGWKPGRMRVLIVGGGIAGLTLAALLRKQGVDPVIVERAASFDEAGYSIGVYPIRSRVLYGLGVHDEFMDVSAPYDFYELHDGTGVDVTFHDGSKARFDLVVAADGIHSTTRAQLLEKEEYEMYDSGWGTWVVWTNEPLAAPGTTKEFWGAGHFLGIYPVKGALMACFGGPKRIALDQSLGTLADRARKLFAEMDPAIADPVIAALEKDPNPFFWDLHDYRSKTWYRGRVVLVGDAAAGFLPTAGIGASMALNGAASLADELTRTDAKYLDVALRAYERRQKTRTEKAQTLSRELGKFMLMESRTASRLRDEFSKFYTAHQFAHDTLALMESEIS